MAQIKTANNTLNAGIVKQMLHHFRTYNFIKTANDKTIEFGFITENLKELLRKEWILTNVVSSDQPAFLFHSLKTGENLKTAFEDVKSSFKLDSFSIVEIDEKKEKPLPVPNNAVDLVRNQFRSQNGTILRNLYFCSSAEGPHMFFKKQRERKIWWRKFSALPARFTTSKVNNENKNSMISEIKAEFLWGAETVETIKCLDLSEYNKNFFEEKSSKFKKSLPQVIVCETMLENMTFTYLCDSYEKLNEEKERDVLGFNKKLAPFKVSIAGTGDSSETLSTLEELSLLLAKQIRKLGISVLLLPDICATTIERQILRNDALGVPYTILLNDKTLKDGIIALRSRDTTLEEQSHVSLIVDYLNKLLR